MRDQGHLASLIWTIEVLQLREKVGVFSQKAVDVLVDRIGDSGFHRPDRTLQAGNPHTRSRVLGHCRSLLQAAPLSMRRSYPLKKWADCRIVIAALRSAASPGPLMHATNWK